MSDGAILLIIVVAATFSTGVTLFLARRHRHKRTATGDLPTDGDGAHFRGGSGLVGGGSGGDGGGG